LTSGKGRTILSRGKRCSLSKGRWGRLGAKGAMRAGIWRSVAIWTLFVLLALALYRPVLPEPLYNDDWVLLRVTPRDLLRPFFAGLYYRPVVVASALLNRALFGDGPLGFNLVNLALHVLVSLLVVRVGRALRGGGGAPPCSRASLSSFILLPWGPRPGSWGAAICSLRSSS